MPIDDRSPNRSYQLPAAGNLLADDVSRLRAALNAIDADVFARYTKTEVDTLINNLIAAAPGALNTLQELAAAMGDDPNFAATVATVLEQKANIIDVYSKAQSDAGAGAPADDTVTRPKLRDGAVTPAKLAQPFTRTAEANAAGNSVIFTGIPDWAKRITLVFNAVSTNGTSPVVIKLGNNTEDAFGYASGYSLVPNPSDGPVRSERGSSASGIYVSGNNTSTDNRYGTVTIHDTGSRAWIASGVVGTAQFDNVSMVWGAVRLTAALDRVRVTTVNGTDTFDFGTITLFYE